MIVGELLSLTCAESDRKPVSPIAHRLGVLVSEIQSTRHPSIPITKTRRCIDDGSYTLTLTSKTSNHYPLVEIKITNNQFVELLSFYLLFLASV